MSTDTSPAKTDEAAAQADGDEAIPKPGSSTAARVTAGCTIGILLILTAVAMRHAQTFFAPVFVAILLALVFAPVVEWLRRWRIPASLSSIGVVLALLGILYAGFLVFAVPVAGLIDRAPTIAKQAEERLKSFRGIVEAVRKADDSVEKATKGDKPGPIEVVVKKPNLLQNAAETAPSILFQFGFGTVLLLFLLTTLSAFRERAIATRDSFAAKLRTARIFRDVQHQVSDYLFTVTCVNAGLGIVTGACLYAIGMPDAALWGAIVAFLNFFPFIGPIVAAAAVALTALVSHPSPDLALFAPAIVVVLHVIESQFVTPNVLGRRLTLNPMIVFLFLGFWGWLWGPIGAIISVPMLVVLKSVCDRVESLATLGALIGTERPTRIAAEESDTVPEPRDKEKAAGAV